MGRKNYNPGSNDTDKAVVNYDTNSFTSGIIKGGQKIPPDAIADGYDIIIRPDEIQGREGSTLYTTVEIPALDNRTGYTASKTAGVITATSSVFTSSGVGNFFVFPGDPDKHYKITSYISGTQIGVFDTTTAHTSTASCYLRGASNLKKAWHKTQRKWIFMWGTQIYIADPDLSSLTRCLLVSVGDEPSDSFSTYEDFGEYTGLIFNSSGIFKIDLSYDTPIVYKINILTPSNTMVDVDRTDDSKYKYNYIYSASKLKKGATVGEQNRLRPYDGITIELETGANKWDDNSYQDYSNYYTEKPIGIPRFKYAMLTCGTLASPYDNVGGWQDLTQNGSFGLNIGNSTTYQIIVDFSNVETMTEVAAVIQAAIRDIFSYATCEFDIDHFVITSGTETLYNPSDGDQIDYLSAGTALNTVDIQTYLEGRAVDGAVISMEYPVQSHVIGPLYVPEIIKDSGNYQTFLTHFPIYRTRDLMGRYTIDSTPDSLYDPNSFILTYELRTCAAFYGQFIYGSETNFYPDSGKGELSEADIGSVLETEYGSRYEITAYEWSWGYYVVTLLTSPGVPQYQRVAAAIGNGRVFRASQSGYIVTRTHGDTFKSDDVGKAIKWAGYEWVFYITEYLSPNQVNVSESQTISTTGMTMDPTYRYYNDNVDDSTLNTRETRYKLKQRFWQPIPSGNVGKVVPGLIFVANNNELSYGQTPDTTEYLHGFHDQGYQITRQIKGNIQAMWLFQDVLTIWTNDKTWRWQTSGYQFIINPYTKDAILQINGVETADDDRGLYSIGSLESIGDGAVMLLTFESGQIGWRAYNGYQYGPDVLIDPNTGKQKIPEIQDLSKETIALYDGQVGMMLYGEE